MKKLDNLTFEQLSNPQTHQLIGGRWVVVSTALYNDGDTCNTAVRMQRINIFGNLKEEKHNYD